MIWHYFLLRSIEIFQRLKVFCKNSIYQYPITTVIVLALIANFLHGYYLNDDFSMGIPKVGGSITKSQLLILNKLGAFSKKQIWDGAIIAYWSHMFFHLGWLHLMINSYLLLIIGSEIEKHETKFLYILIILISDCISFGMELLISGRSGVGISGAIFGLIGFVLTRNKSPWIDYDRGKSAIVLGIQFILFCVLDYLDIVAIANIAHLAGFACGVLLARLNNIQYYNLGKIAFYKNGKLRIEHLILCLLVIFSLLPTAHNYMI